MGSDRKPKWTDETSYSQNDKERVPRTWAVELGRVKLIVTRVHGIHGSWFLRAPPFVSEVEYTSDDLEGAKAELLERVDDGLLRSHLALGLLAEEKPDAR